MLLSFILFLLDLDVYVSTYYNFVIKFKLISIQLRLIYFSDRVEYIKVIYV